ncbi:MAG: type II secretion system protein, partial [Acidobacteria bacterium]|nr:type II secretion system protein [Acidobacteriota bacterium]
MAAPRHVALPRFVTARGFTIVELLLIVGIFCVISAISVPGLLRARAASNESSAIGSVRAIYSAQMTYAATCGAGFFSPSLRNLATPPPGTLTAFIGPELNRNNVVKSGYRIRFRRGAIAAGSPMACNGARAGSLLQSFFVSADPISGAGYRHFGANQIGTIYQNASAVAVIFNGPPPPPA